MQTDNKPLLRDLDADWRNTHPDWSGEWYTIEQVEQDAMLLEARRDQREREEIYVVQDRADLAAKIVKGWLGTWQEEEAQDAN